ncbi:MAG: hypothetical protein IT208_12105 [Chthonomonadales bacterium]|nr:hypothetical protein [Chthonomonadales bacterium]
MNEQNRLDDDSAGGAWLRAARALDPTLRVARTVALLGLYERFACCAAECGCRSVEATWRAAPDRLGRVGMRAWPIAPGQPGRAAARARRALERGDPVVAARDGGEGLLAREEGIWFVLEHAAPVPGEERLTSAELGASRAFVVRRSRAARGRPRATALVAVAEWAVWALSSPVPAICQSAGPALCSTGAAGLEAWASAARGLAAFGPAEHARAQVLVGGLLAVRAFLGERAGAGRTPPTLRMRRAADALGDCVELVEAARAQPGTAAPALRMAAAGLTRAAGHAAEGALMGMGLPPEVRSALLEEPATELRNVALHDTVYLARAAVAPVRRLAARRLAGCARPLAVSTLAELLFAADVATAETALWAITRHDLEVAWPVLAGAARRLPRSARAAERSVVPSVLWWLAELDEARAEPLLREVAAASGERASRVRDWAARLLRGRSAGG